MAILVLLTLAALTPFLARPFHVDDPVFLWSAEQIRRHPLDFYGTTMNWHGVEKPMADGMQNPPLACYYIALVSAAVPASLLEAHREVVLHAAFLLPAVAVVLGTYFLARELNARALTAGLLTLFSPVFLLCASSLMGDMPMLAFYTWAAWAWVRGMRSRRGGWLWLSAALAALAALTKYFGVSLIPLLLAYGLLKDRRRIGRWATPMLLPLAVLIVYQIYTKHLYGRGLLLDAVRHASATHEGASRPAATLLLSALSFAGGGCLTAVAALVTGFRRRGALLLTAISLAAVTAAAAVVDGARDPLFEVQLGIFVTAGAALLTATAVRARQSRGEAGAVLLLLLLWLGGTFVFAGCFNWAVTGRSVLAMAPAAALLAASPGGEVAITSSSRRYIAAAVIALGAALSLLCVAADQSHAHAARAAAEEVRRRFETSPASAAGKTVWFRGHWGFQWYMQRWGARPIDPLRSPIRAGDWFVDAVNNSGFEYDTERGALPAVLNFAEPTLPFLADMNPSVRAGFYSDQWGPLPYAFGRVPPDPYEIREIRGPLRPMVGP